MTQTAPKFLTTRDLANLTGLSVDYFQTTVDRHRQYFTAHNSCKKKE